MRGSSCRGWSRAASTDAGSLRVITFGNYRFAYGRGLAASNPTKILRVEPFKPARSPRFPFTCFPFICYARNRKLAAMKCERPLLTGAEVDLGKLIRVGNTVAVCGNRIVPRGHVAINGSVRLDDPDYLAVQPDIRSVARFVGSLISIDPDTGVARRYRWDDHCPRQWGLGAIRHYQHEGYCRTKSADGQRYKLPWHLSLRAE